MSYSFNCDIFGVVMQVSGEFEPGEPQTMTDLGFPPEFVIETVEHCGNELDWDCFPAKELDYICDTAFEKAGEEAGY